jgi:hypothetical protein
MTRRSVRIQRQLAAGLALALGLALFAPGVRAQDGETTVRPMVVPDGLMSRWTPPRTVLPPDPDRDHFYYGKKWANAPSTKPNWPCTSGLYGLNYTDRCTTCYAPYFFGTPGGNNAEPCCEKVKFRLIGNFVHPWRPVGGYYSGGCATPIYDLDPIVPGPGLFPWSWIQKRQHMGG